MDGRSVGLALEPQDGRVYAPRKSERGRAMAKVSIIGAGNVGATAASHIAALGLADVVLLDINEGIARGKALDMMHMCSVLDSGLKVRGTSDYADTAESDVVVITAGVARKPGMTREDLLATNASIMTSSVRQAIALSPNAIVICVSNPLNVTTYLACSHAGIPASRVIGMGGRLDCARLKFAICEKLGVHPSRVEAWVLGNHGQGMVCLPRICTVDGKPLASVMSAEDIREACERACNSGIEIVDLLQTGSSFYGPAAGIFYMVEAILRDTGVEMTACVKLDGEYGIHDMCMNVPVVLGREGVREIIELDLNAEELSELQSSAEDLKSMLATL